MTRTSAPADLGVVSGLHVAVDARPDFGELDVLPERFCVQTDLGGQFDEDAFGIGTLIPTVSEDSRSD